MDVSKNKILIIDDDADIGNILKTILEYKGYTVLLLKSAVNCLDYLRSNRVGLIIMDLLISGVYGVDVCKELKDDPLLSSIPVIMMSAHPDAKRICMEAGTNDFIAKPFDMAELLGKVKN